MYFLLYIDLLTFPKLHSIYPTSPLFSYLFDWFTFLSVNEANIQKEIHTLFKNMYIYDVIGKSPGCHLLNLLSYTIIFLMSIQFKRRKQMIYTAIFCHTCVRLPHRDRSSSPLISHQSMVLWNQITWLIWSLSKNSVHHDDQLDKMKILAI